MRYLMTLILTVFMVTPAFADSYCSINGPHNCKDQIEDVLTASTKNTIHKMEAFGPTHAFPTENDEILAQASREEAINNFNNATNTGIAFLAR